MTGRAGQPRPLEWIGSAKKDLMALPAQLRSRARRLLYTKVTTAANGSALSEAELCGLWQQVRAVLGLPAAPDPASTPTLIGAGGRHDS